MIYVFLKKSEYEEKNCSMKDSKLKYSCSKSEERLKNFYTEMLIPQVQETSSTGISNQPVRFCYFWNFHRK